MSKNSTRLDRKANELAKAWAPMPLNAARDVLTKQNEGGCPSVLDAMDRLLPHYDDQLRDFGSLCLGVGPALLKFTREAVRIDSPKFPYSGLEWPVTTGECEGIPIFSGTSRDTPAVAISGGKNCGKTTLLHSLIEQAKAVTSPRDTRIVLINSDSDINLRVAGDERVEFMHLDGSYVPTEARQEIFFIDDADDLVRKSPAAWKAIEALVMDSPRRVYATMTVAAPRTVPRDLLTRSIHVNLAGGTLQNTEKHVTPWAFTVSDRIRGGDAPLRRGLVFGDLPEGVSQIHSGDPFRGSTISSRFLTHTLTAGELELDGPVTGWRTGRIGTSAAAEIYCNGIGTAQEEDISDDAAACLVPDATFILRETPVEEANERTSKEGIEWIESQASEGTRLFRPVLTRFLSDTLYSPHSGVRMR